MRKTSAVVLLALLVVFASAPAILVVEATKPQTVNGSYNPTGAPAFSNDRPAGKSDNGFVDVSIPVMWTGGIAGMGVNEMHWIAHNEATVEEVVIIQGITTLTAGVKIWGVAEMGTLTIEIKNVVVGSVPIGGQWRIIGGTGELASLHGEGSLTGTSNPYVIGYSGQVHFDP